jgi:glycosyltransferase involved in cell wall biosynthesis
MLLKTASLLKQLDVEFEWTVAGNIDDSLRKMIEKKEKTTFKENNVNILGFVKPDKLIELLSECTMMVHTAYIENSPNSICVAQCLGVPVVSTNVGGISTLVRDGVDGILVPANDPWQMVYNIVSLSLDTERMKTMSRMTRERALSRHNPDNILGQLLDCYRSILK